MKEDYKELTQEWFADCTTVQEVAELYAELLHEIKIQMNFMMDRLTEVQP